jgi:PEGA domain
MPRHALAALIVVWFLFPATPARAQGTRSDFGSIAVRVVPANAEVFIDGERWVGTQSDGRLVVQLLPGRHHVEIRARGYRVYESDVEVRSGETAPLNVSLIGSPGEGREVPPGPPPPLNQPSPVYGSIRQVADTGEESGFAFSPDFRIAEVNHHTDQFLGGYGGVVYAGRLFVGLGGYWQLDDSHHDLSLAYGGGVFEWRQWNTKPVALTLHALVGGGDAHVGNNFYYPGGYPQPYHGGGYYYGDYGYHEGFFVFEPEAQVNVRLSRDVRFGAGAGYRVTSTYHGGVSGDQLNGWSASFNVRFGR